MKAESRSSALHPHRRSSLVLGENSPPRDANGLHGAFQVALEHAAVASALGDEGSEQFACCRIEVSEGQVACLRLRWLLNHGRRAR